MDVSDIKSLHSEVKKRMDGVLDHVRRELAGVRTGRASVNLLDSVQVEAWGSLLPLNQVATLSVPESTLIVATPFDPSQMGAIEKAIRSSNLGLNPANDGKVVRIPLPPLTEERRKEFAKIAKKYGEECKVAIRKARHDALDMFNEIDEAGDASTDDVERAKKKAEDTVADAGKQVDTIVGQKEKDIMEV